MHSSGDLPGQSESTYLAGELDHKHKCCFTQKNLSQTNFHPKEVGQTNRKSSERKISGARSLRNLPEMQGRGRGRQPKELWEHFHMHLGAVLEYSEAVVWSHLSLQSCQMTRGSTEHTVLEEFGARASFVEIKRDNTEIGYD